MDKLLSIWDASKGKIAIAGVVFLLGLPAVGTFLGIGIVEGGPCDRDWETILSVLNTI